MKMTDLLLLIALLGATNLFAQAIPKVLMIGIDGVRSDALEVAATPYLDELISDGIYSPDALNEDITISGPGWSAILCGVWSDKHLVTGNNFSGNNYSEYPSFFRRVEEFNSDLHTASFCHWSPINDHIIVDDADFRLNFSADAEVASVAANYLTVNDPDVLFLHFDDVDGAGHGSGFTPDNPTYVGVIEQTDVYVGQVLEAMRNRETFDGENWLIIVTTDHGGLGTSHGGNSFEEQNVFFIVSGQSVAPEVILKDSLYESASVDPCIAQEEVLFFGGNGSQIEIPTHPDFSFGEDRDFTLECRVRTSVSADVSIVGNKDWDSGLNPGFVFSFSYPSGPEWKVNIGDGNGRVDLNVGGEIADNQWHTLTATFDRDGLLKMYEDGEWIAETDISGIGNIDTGSGLFFGSDMNAAYSYAGYISEVRVWDSVLSPDVIADWSCSVLNDTHPAYQQLLGYWPLTDGASSAQIEDESGNAHNGQNNGAEWQGLDSVLVEDFSMTPRLVDAPVTALQHLCIPLLDVWNLDGRSYVEACNITSLNQVEQETAWQLAPNPTKEGQEVRLIGQHSKELRSVSVYNMSGHLLRIIDDFADSLPASLKIGKFPAGNYMLSFTYQDGNVRSLMLNVN